MTWTGRAVCTYAGIFLYILNISYVKDIRASKITDRYLKDYILRNLKS